MIKKILFFFLIFSLTNCSYESIYSKKKDLNSIIKSYQLEGDRIINRRIISFLNLDNKGNRDSKVKLKLTTNKAVNIIAKDKMGNASYYETVIIVNLILTNEDGVAINKKIFNENFTYSSKKNKFELSQYQNNIEINLVEKISEEIIIFLNS